MSTPISTPIDYFGLDSTPLKLKSSTAGKTLQNKGHPDERGDIVARSVYGEAAAPTCLFEVIAAGNLTLSLGSVNTEDSVVYMLTGGSIATKFGTPCSVSLKGISLQAGATVSSTITTGAIALVTLDKAVFLMGCATMTGAGCELNECNLEISSNPSLHKVAGVIVAHDIAGGMLVAKCTILQTGAEIPVITAGSGWVLTSPLTSDNPDEDVPTWTCELTKDLVSAEPGA